MTGTVTIRGKPMKGGEITFDPANYQRKDAAKRTGKINDDGTYEVTTLVGHNTVLLSGPAITKEPNLGYRLLRAIYPVFRMLLPSQVIRADDLARVMVDVAVRRTKEPRASVFENDDIRAMVEWLRHLTG